MASIFFLCIFTTFWAMVSGARPQRASRVPERLKEAIAESNHSKSLKSRPQSVQAANDIEKTIFDLFGESFGEFTHLSFAQKREFDKKYNKSCKYVMNCDGPTRLGIGRQNNPLYWTLWAAIPLGMASVIIAVTSLKARFRSPGTLTSDARKVSVAMLIATCCAFAFGHACSMISGPGATFANLFLMSMILVSLTFSISAVLWFSDIECAWPTLRTSAFLICVSVLRCAVFILVNRSMRVLLMYAQKTHSITISMFAGQAYGTINLLSAAAIPRTVSWLWILCRLKFYHKNFFWWDDTTGDADVSAQSWVFPLTFNEFLFTIIQVAFPYARDRYSVAAFGCALQVMVKLGLPKHQSFFRFKFLIYIAQVIIIIFLCSIFQRYQIALPAELRKVRYVRLGYLYELRRNGQKISRSQEVPERAFGNPAKVVHMIIVSHHWLDGLTCDVTTPECPQGFRLTTICQRLEQYFPSTWPGFCEFCRQPMSILARAFFHSAIYVDDDVLIFFDYMSLMQIGVMSDGTPIERTTEETALFKETLPACGLLYTMFPVLVCPEVTEGVTTYFSSGWCFCELEQAKLSGTLSPYSEDHLPFGSRGRSLDAGRGFAAIEDKMKSKGFRTESDRDIVLGIVKGAWIRHQLEISVRAQDVKRTRELLQQLSDHSLQHTINFPVDSSTLDTLLHVLKRYETVSVEIEPLLVEYGADPTRHNHRGEMPGEFLIYPRAWFPCLLEEVVAIQESAKAGPRHFFTQAELKELVKSAAGKEVQFVKTQPIATYPLLDNSIESMPQKLFDHLGDVDKATYGESPAEVRAFMHTQVGGAMSLQFNGDNPDFYLISPDVYSTMYVKVPVTEVEENNPKLHGKLAGYFGTDYVDTIPNITGAIKTALVTMVKVSDLGFAPSADFAIKAPWGGEQEKVSDSDAFIVVEASGDSFYICNADAEGQPIGYVTEKQLANMKQGPAVPPG